MLPNRIHIVGASGSGTTSLAAALSARHGHRHLDTDDFYWLSTDPPYREKRPVPERLSLLRAAMAESPSSVLSGSLCSWGDPLVPEFDLVVFVLVPHDVRMARLVARETRRYGAAGIAPGGVMHENCAAFLDWARRYDTGGTDVRSRVVHEAWLATLPCPTLRLQGDRPIAEQLALVEAAAGGVDVTGDRSSHLGLESGSVRLVPHDPAWGRLFTEEAIRIRAALGPDLPLALEHVGSTAVPELPAKPILDLAGGYPQGASAVPYIAALARAGYTHRGESGIPGREFFRLGDPRTHHLHLVAHSSALWREHLLFRDALRADPAVRAQYGTLKADLMRRFPRDREAYTEGKSAFIRGVIDSALSEQ